MKVTSVKANNRRRCFEIEASEKVWTFPFVKCEPPPTPENRITKVYVDPEIGNEGFVYILKSGAEGTVHIEQALDYNCDPAYVRDMMVYKLTVEAQKQMAKSGISHREVIRRLETSATQLYRLLDQTNYSKSVDQMLLLLNVLGCDVRFEVLPRSA